MCVLCHYNSRHLKHSPPTPVRPHGWTGLKVNLVVMVFSCNVTFHTTATHSGPIYWLRGGLQQLRRVLPRAAEYCRVLPSAADWCRLVLKRDVNTRITYLDIRPVKNNLQWVISFQQVNPSFCVLYNINVSSFPQPHSVTQLCVRRCGKKAMSSFRQVQSPFSFITSHRY